MKEMLLFDRDDCGYCHKAHRALAELFEENPAYRAVPLRLVDEVKEAAYADTFDYYAVPTIYVDGKKRFEAHIGMSFEAIRAEVKAALDAALKD